MVWYDFVILAILIYTTWSGAQKGLVTQLAWIAALILCFKFADKLAPAIEPRINVEQPLRHWIAMFILYVGFSLGSFMVARILNSWLENAKFKDFDRHLGGMLGLLKGVVVAMVITFFAVTLSESLKATVLQSKTGHAACAILDNVEPLTPDYFHEYLVKYREELAAIHNDSHLGQPTSITDLLNSTGTGSSQAGGRGQGGDFGFSEFLDGFQGTPSGTSVGSVPPQTTVSDVPTLDQLWRALPGQLKDQLGDQIQQRWNSAAPEQKRQLMDDLAGAFDYQIPTAVSNFLSQRSVSPAPTPLGGLDSGGIEEKLNQIGDIYQDRSTIVARTMQHLAGVPPQIQKAVIDDWYADLTLQGADPDPGTRLDARLDERILRQLDKANIWQQLSLELKQRLNQSRQ
ncbi:MAG: CvpA family protein [Planctomycetaceae bacterium]